MDKPSTVLHREFVNNLQQLINDSGLPAFVLVPVVRDVLRQLEQLQERHYQDDLRKWSEENKNGGDLDGRQEDQ